MFITLSSNAQVDSTTGNLINYGSTPTDTTSVWNNGVYVNQVGCFGGNTPGNCGPYPSVRTDGNINFSYGQVNLNQIVNINKALAAGGTGVQLSGFNFGFLAKNGNGWDDGRQDYLSAYVKFYNAGGGLAANYDYTSQTNQRYNWTQFNFSETFANPSAASNYSNAQVGFVGRDNNYWAGPYGPEINNVSFSLKYRVDPCATNPAYSSTCAGFSNVINTNNLLDSTKGGSSLNQAFAINTALGLAGTGAIVHGFNYGFNYTVGQGFSGCTATNQDGSCSWYMNTPAYVNAGVSLTNSSNQVIHQKNYSFTQDGTSGSVSEKYLLPSSMNQTLLGTARLTASSSGTGSSVSGAWANIIYTADPCAVNPLSSPTCSGYGAAFAKTLSTASTTTTTTAPALAPLPPALAEAAPALAEAAPALASPTAQTAPPPAAPPPPVQDTAVAQSDPAQPSPTQAGPAPTGPPAPAGGPPQTATASASSSTSSGPSTSSAGPSKLAMSVLKTAQANDKATQTAAVQAAAKTLETATQSSQASSNMAISMNQDMSANSAVAAAQFASQATQASQQTAVQVFQSPQTVSASSQTQQASKTGPQVQQQTQQDVQQVQSQGSNTTTQLQAPQQTQPQVQMQTASSSVQTPPPAYTPPQQQQDMQSSSVVTLRPPMQVQVEVQQQASSGTGLTISRNPFAYSPLSSVNSSNVAMFQTQPAPTFQSRIDTRQLEVETPQVQVATFGGAGKAGNPLSDMMQQKFELMQDNISQSTSSVNRNVQPNDLAGKVDLAAMATVPAGFTAYSFVLRDAAFYEPKEVYKNQKTVDNVRILRGLTGGSDALHQRMVDSQYK